MLDNDGSPPPPACAACGQAPATGRYYRVFGSAGPALSLCASCVRPAMVPLCEVCGAAPATVRLHRDGRAPGWRCKAHVDRSRCVPLAPVALNIDGGNTPEERRQLAEFFARLDAEEVS